MQSQGLLSQASSNCPYDVDRAQLGEQNFWDAPEFSSTHILPYKKEKPLDLQVFSRVG